ncbi:MAG TPA: hypothetical protein H9903_07105 [Candidatus Aquabacterium excrementipullorum]|nr:hypothetical protein [Candidatus Aquabacterium excrementipullorum]
MAQNDTVVNYDVAVIHEFARELYRKSVRREKQGVMLGFLFGLALTVSVISAASLDTQLGRWPAVVLGFVIVAFCTWFGMKLGLDAGLRLKLQAQLALCQAAIEQNTRAGR